MSSKKKVSTKKIKMLCTQGSKGGVGKTFFAAQVASWLKAQGRRYVVIDLDTENVNSGLQHYIREATKIDIHTIETLDILLNASQTADIVLVDMPAANGYMFFDWMHKNYETCDELGIEFVIFCLINSAPGTVENVLHWANALQNFNMSFLPVLNPMTESNAQFEIWKKAKEVSQFKAVFGDQEILLPSIREDIAPYLALAGLTLQDALLTEENKDTLPKALAKFSIQMHLRRWGRQIFTQLDARNGTLLS